MFTHYKVSLQSGVKAIPTPTRLIFLHKKTNEHAKKHKEKLLIALFDVLLNVPETVGCYHIQSGSARFINELQPSVPVFIPWIRLLNRLSKVGLQSPDLLIMIPYDYRRKSELDDQKSCYH